MAATEEGLQKSINALNDYCMLITRKPNAWFSQKHRRQQILISQ